MPPKRHKSDKEFMKTDKLIVNFMGKCSRIANAIMKEIIICSLIAKIFHLLSSLEISES